MEHDPRAWLRDILEACDEIKSFTTGISLEDYSGNSLIRAAVERKFLVIGEAMVRLRDESPDFGNQIADLPKIIGFRNVLVHGYDVIDDATVWSAINENLPTLRSQIEQLI